MINFTNIRKTITASIGAVFISTLFVVAAIGNPVAAGSTPSMTVQAQA
ncbi:MAG: hypothetical protein QOD42_102 [Sphingomonadales bacterium]|jgi:hypothetical protein|nr:hypothetical protein [Sphingomonadales bacterium]